MPQSAQDSGVLRWGATSSWWVDPKGRLWSGGLVGLSCSTGGSLEEAVWWASGSTFQTSAESRSPTPPPFQHPSKSPLPWDPSLSKVAWLSACLSRGYRVACQT